MYDDDFAQSVGTSGVVELEDPRINAAFAATRLKPN